MCRPPLSLNFQQWSSPNGWKQIVSVQVGVSTNIRPLTEVWNRRITTTTVLKEVLMPDFEIEIECINIPCNIFCPKTKRPDVLMLLIVKSSYLGGMGRALDAHYILIVKAFYNTSVYY